MVIAYEPVWAIGTGEVAKPNQAAAAVDYIRSYVRDIFDEPTVKQLRVLYGGSVVPDVAHGFLNVPGVDGFLVGGASLNYRSFTDIIESAHRWQREAEREHTRELRIAAIVKPDAQLIRNHCHRDQ